MRRLPEEQHVDAAGSQSAFVFHSDVANADEICITGCGCGWWEDRDESSAILNNSTSDISNKCVLYRRQLAMPVAMSGLRVLTAVQTHQLECLVYASLGVASMTNKNRNVHVVTGCRVLLGDARRERSQRAISIVHVVQH